MRRHKNGERENKEVMVHPSNGDTWKALDNFDPKFARNVRNVHTGLSIDSFTPFGENTTSYSYRHIFVVPYNLPPSLCMKYEFMFLCLMMPDTYHPKSKLNVMLKSLIDEFKELWKGVEAYDSNKKQKSILQVAYTWLVHNFMTYNIFVGCEIDLYDMWFGH
jgi:hypothetical protein